MGTNIPVTAWLTSSGTPPARVATMGTPKPRASMTATGRPSCVDASTIKISRSHKASGVAVEAENPKICVKLQVTSKPPDLGLFRALTAADERHIWLLPKLYVPLVAASGSPSFYDSWRSC